MQQIICKTGCIQSVGGAIDSTAAQYNAVQSARLTVVLQKNVQTWSGTWDDIFVFSAGGAGSAALAHEMRLSSGVYRAKIIADVYDPGGIRADTSTVYTAERIVS